MAKRIVLLGLTVLLLIACNGYFLSVSNASLPAWSYGALIDTPQQEFHKEDNSITSLSFVGDVMLSRFVHTLATRHGLTYSFSLFDTSSSSGYLVGNFEGCFSEKPHNPKASMMFPVSPAFASVLRTAGFTHLSLANNHASDCGVAGYHDSLRIVASEGMVPFGHPRGIGDGPTTFLELGSTTVALIGLHAVGLTEDESLIQALRDARQHSSVQIVFIHWGNEYEPQHSVAQARLAQFFIDHGVDLIMGHHPHVVQDIGFIDGVPVVYSLGNFIFDQYFSLPVQEGLLVRLHSQPEWSLELVPIESQSVRSSPRLMEEERRNTFLRNLSLRSDLALQEQISVGRIVLGNRLATSSKMVMIGQ